MAEILDLEFCNLTAKNRPSEAYSCSQLDTLQIISSHLGARHCRALTSVFDSTDNRYILDFIWGILD